MKINARQRVDDICVNSIYYILAAEKRLQAIVDCVLLLSSPRRLRDRVARATLVNPCAAPYRKEDPGPQSLVTRRKL